MQCKTVEIRDRLTLIAALAVRLDPGTPADRFLLAHSGFGLTSDEQTAHVALLKLGTDTRAHIDPLDWLDRTMMNAHRHIVENFDAMTSGDVVDVEFILGETKQPKTSERPS